MIDFIVGSFFSFYMIVFLVVIGAILDYRSRNYLSTFVVLMCLIITYKIFDISLTATAIFAFAYLPIGYLWSKRRFNLYCKNVKRDLTIESEMLDEMDKESDEYIVAVDIFKAKVGVNKQRLNPIRNIDLIVTWVLCWPLSIIGNLIGDLFDLLDHVIRTRLLSVYRLMFEKASAELDAISGKYEEIEKEKVDNK